MPFSHNGLKTTTGIQLLSVSQVNKHTLSYRFLNGNVHGCVFAKNRPVSLNWSDYTYALISKAVENMNESFIVYNDFAILNRLPEYPATLV